MRATARMMAVTTALALLCGVGWADGPQKARDTRSGGSTGSSSGSVGARSSGSGTSGTTRGSRGATESPTSTSARGVDTRSPERHRADGEPVAIETDRRDGRSGDEGARVVGSFPLWLGVGSYWYTPGFYSPYWYWNRWGGWPGYVRYRDPRRQRIGALDLDVSPEEAEVYVDGERVGIADNFDGFPEYLWLPEGTYELTFYHPGRRTLTRQYSIYPGVTIDVEDRMEEGEATRPMRPAAAANGRSEVHRDRDVERRRARPHGTDEWRQRRGRPPAARVEESSGGVDAAAGELGRLLLAVEPADASIYVDGRLLGTAGELSALRSGLALESGEHVVQIVRPGFEPREERVSLAAGDEIELELELEEL